MKPRTKDDEAGPSKRTRQQTAKNTNNNTNKEQNGAAEDSSDSDFEEAPASKKRKNNSTSNKSKVKAGNKTKVPATNRNHPVESESENEEVSTEKNLPSSQELQEEGTSQGLTWKLPPDAEQLDFPRREKSISVVAFMDSRTKGIRTFEYLKNGPITAVMDYVKKFHVFKTASPFSRRVTALTWHPTVPDVLAVASKGGDIILWNYQQPKPSHTIQGRGPGGSVQTMTFDPLERSTLYVVSIDGELSVKDMEHGTSKAFLATDNWKVTLYFFLLSSQAGPDGNIFGLQFDIQNPDWLYMASLTGTVGRRNVCSQASQFFLETGNHNHWYTALDVSFSNRTMIAGDNKGYVNLLTTDGSPVWKLRLHKSKVLHAEFNHRESWLLVTSSTDDTVKLWDIRMISDKTSALFVLKHNKPVNAAHFSATNGYRLLTTDQHSELRIYSGPSWQLETQIAHPHRQFQHLTPIKASWHPLEDIVVVGRYPDPKMKGYSPAEQRSVDFFDASDGKLLYQLMPSSVSGIISLNRFNPRGDTLASGMGFHTLIWKPKFVDKGEPTDAEDIEEKRKDKEPEFKVSKKDDELKKKRRKKSDS